MSYVKLPGKCGMKKKISECLECGEPGNPLLTHPQWPADSICTKCHKGEWDEWMEERLIEYKEATGVEWNEDL